MNLKICLFDRSTIKSDFKRFWWVSVIYMLLTALFVLPRAVTKNPYYVQGGWDYSYVTDNGFLALCFAFLLGGMIFSYLHKGNSVSCFHGLPLTRKNLYFSHFIAGCILLVIPIVMTSLIIGIESLYLGATLKFAVKYLYTCVVYAILTFSVTVFSAMISGSTVAAYIFTMGFIALPGFAVYVAQYILDINLYGFDGNFNGFIYNYIYIAGVNDMWSYKSLWYVVLIAVIFVSSYILYKIRKLENYDDIVVFKYLKPVFMYTAAVCFGVFGYVVIYDVANCSNLFLGTLPLGCTALIAAFMLNSKSFGVKGLFRPLAVFVICLGAVSISFAVDLTGYERRIPSKTDIESIDAYSNVYNDNIIDIKYIDNANKNFTDNINDLSYKECITEENTIEDILNLHKAVVEDKVTGQNNSRIALIYNLKNGKQLKRTYDVDNRVFAEYLKPYYENTVYKKYCFPIVNDREKDINYIEYSGINLKNSIKLNETDSKEIYEAIEKDIYDLKYKDILYVNSRAESGIYLYVYYDEYTEYKGERLKLSCRQAININESFKNTVKLLKEKAVNYSDKFITADKINYASMEIFGYTDTLNLEADEARKIYDYFANMEYEEEGVPNNRIVEFQMTFFTEGEDISQYFIMPYSQLPYEIRKYMDNIGDIG